MKWNEISIRKHVQINIFVYTNYHKVIADEHIFFRTDLQ